jgi:Protein of unknown function (DUF4229)
MNRPADSPDDPPAPPSHAGLQYAALRLLLLVVVGAVLYLVGMRSLPWLIATVLVSAGLSFVVLLKQREAAARSLEASLSARARRRHTADPQGPGTPGASLPTPGPLTPTTTDAVEPSPPRES